MTSMVRVRGETARARARVCAVAVMLFAACTRSNTEPIPATTVASFDRVWASFDGTYPYFALKGVAWAASRTAFRDRAAAAPSIDALNVILLEMLAPLRDVHVALRGPNGAFQPSYRSPYQSNFDRDRWLQTMNANQYVQHRTNLSTARIGGIPYIAIGAWNGEQFTVNDLDQALARFQNDSMLIVDVRMNGGGNDQLALDFAGRFVETPTVCEQYRYRTGPAPTDLGRLTSRVVAPRGPWTFRGRVYVLIGRSVFSSNESFVAAMRVAPRVQLLGDTTGGGSANPVTVPYANGWTVSVSRWYASLPDGEPIEGKGIAPHVYIPLTASAQGDPIIAAAIAHITTAQATRRQLSIGASRQHRVRAVE
ncbi:MAG: S41 family peptidase [Gemmatimonadaceae bacterium]|nr:S41 family peptidase [Gemmatimonadaceae bacterium]